METLSPHAIPLTPVTHFSIENELRAHDDVTIPASGTITSADNPLQQKFSVRVVLLSGAPSLLTQANDSGDFPHLTQMIRFLAMKKDRTLQLIGGPWAEIDGSDPDRNEQTLINTAMYDMIYLCCLHKYIDGQRKSMQDWI